MPTTLHDLVCVHIDSKPAFYARIENIEPDRKPGWWQVKLLVLTYPLQVYTWILEESQINGEQFTMGGTPVVLQKVELPEEPAERATSSPSTGEHNGSDIRKEPAKIVSIFERKKDK